MSGLPFKIAPRSNFILSGLASLNKPVRSGPITAGDPNLSFRGRWQSEQRCRNKFSPRVSCSLNFGEAEAFVVGALCAKR